MVENGVWVRQNPVFESPLNLGAPSLLPNLLFGCAGTLLRETAGYSRGCCATCLVVPHTSPFTVMSNACGASRLRPEVFEWMGGQCTFDWA